MRPLQPCGSSWTRCCCCSTAQTSIWSVCPSWPVCSSGSRSYAISECPLKDKYSNELRREWYARLGGCTALRFIIEHYPTSFVRHHALIFLNAFLEVSLSQ